MSFLNRLEPLQYESPKKKLFTLQFDNLTRSGGKKVGVNEFPDQNEANEQELGNIANRFPLTCYITGNDYDREADRFFKALEENGVGTLDHPRWGSIDVIPLTYTQTEEFVDGIGRATFTIEFIKYYPDEAGFFSFLQTPFAILELVIEGIDRVLSLETALRRSVRVIQRQIGQSASEINRIKGRTKNVLNSFFNQEKNFGVRLQELKNAIKEQRQKIENNIDAFAKEPAQLVTSLNQLFSLPARVDSSIRAKVNGYTEILNGLKTEFESPFQTFNDFEANVQAYTATAVVKSLIESSLDGVIQTRSEAIEIANNLFNASLTLKEIYGITESKNGNVDYEIYKNIQNAISLCQKLLIDRTLNLPSERTTVIEGEITPLKFLFDKLGSTEQLDFFIEYNKLSGNEIVLLPKGRTVRYIPEVTV